MKTQTCCPPQIDTTVFYISNNQTVCCLVTTVEGKKECYCSTYPVIVSHLAFTRSENYLNSTLNPEGTFHTVCIYYIKQAAGTLESPFLYYFNSSITCMWLDFDRLSLFEMQLFSFKRSDWGIVLSHCVVDFLMCLESSSKHIS